MLINRNIRTSFIAFLALLLAILPLGQVTADKIVPDNIRVGLFLEERGTVPVVTLQAEQGLALGESRSGKFNTWFTHSSQNPVRFSLDQYRLVLAEGLTKEAALQLASKARAAVSSGDVYVSPESSKETYQVIVGGLHSEQRANETLGKVKQLADVVQIEGPHYITAGTYAVLAEAEEAVAVLRNEDVNARLAVHADGDQVHYSVWITVPSDAEEAAAYMEQLLETTPEMTLEQVNDDGLYMIIEEELLTDGQIVPRILVASSGAGLKIQSLGGYIQVQERFARSYRGSMEIVMHKERLALVNELPFEQYLYSVVGTEMGTGWPLGALKAQAVTARTFALKQGTKYGVAHVSDTTYEQAYYGIAREADDVIAAVDATKGEVIVDVNGELITPFYSANAGGMTADSSEVWNGSLDYLKSVPSPDDGPQKNLLPWHRVLLEDGTIGYVRSDYTEETGERTAGGLKILRATASNVNVRLAPFVNNTTNGPIAKLQEGDQLIHLETRMEANSYQWITVPYRASELKAVIEARANMTIDGPLTSLKVTKRGPSARVIEMEANSQTIRVSSPDSYRTIMNNLRSTRFEVEESASFYVLGADGETKEWPITKNPYVISANGETEFTDQMLVLNEGNGARLITREPMFTFIGTGFGHGVGMSQWGARDLAEHMSFDYVQILEYYYNNIEIKS